MTKRYLNVIPALLVGLLFIYAFVNPALSQDADSGSTASQAGKSASSQPAAKTIGRWTINISKAADGGPQVEVRLPANEPYTSPDGGDLHTADFVIGCTRGNTVAFIDWKAALTNDNDNASTLNVAFSIDNSPALNSDWDISSDKRSLISKRSVEFIQSLNARKRLELMLVPDDIGQQTVIFDLANLEVVLKIIGDKCYN